MIGNRRGVLPNPNPQICLHYQRGNCHFGKRCRNVHID